VHAVPGADALVGGQSAATLDTRATPRCTTGTWSSRSSSSRADPCWPCCSARCWSSAWCSPSPPPSGCADGRSLTCPGSPGGDQARSRCSLSCSLVAPGIDDNIFLMTPGPESVHFGTRPGIPARISGHRRGDHLRRCGAGGNLHRPGCAPAGPALAYDIGPTIRWPSSKLATTGQQVPKTRAATAHPTSSRRHDHDKPRIRAEMTAAADPANLTRRVPRPAALSSVATDREADPGPPARL